MSDSEDEEIAERQFKIVLLGHSGSGKVFLYLQINKTFPILIDNLISRRPLLLDIVTMNLLDTIIQHLALIFFLKKH